MNDDFYIDLARQLHEVADKLAILPVYRLTVPRYVTLNVCAGMYESESPGAASIVDAFAAALGTIAEVRHDAGGNWERSFSIGSLTAGSLRVRAHCRVPAPPDPRDVEIERLRAELDANNSRAATAVPPPTGGSPQVRDQSPGSGPGHNSASSHLADRVTAIAAESGPPVGVSPDARTVVGLDRGPGLDAGDGQGTRPAGAGGIDGPPAPATTRGHPCIDVPPGVRVLGDPDYGQPSRSS
jgi:hypothetical protein